MEKLVNKLQKIITNCCLRKISISIQLNQKNMMISVCSIVTEFSEIVFHPQVQLHIKEILLKLFPNNTSSKLRYQLRMAQDDLPLS